MSKNVLVKEKTTGIGVETIIFNSIKDLYEDMLSMQSFIISENIYSGRKPILEGCTIYRHVKLHRDKLCFHGNKFGGSELVIKGNILRMERLSTPDTRISEYKFMIDGLKEPFIFMTCKKSQY